MGDKNLAFWISIGGTEKVWTSCKLAERVYYGGYTDAAEEGDGSST